MHICLVRSKYQDEFDEVKSKITGGVELKVPMKVFALIPTTVVRNDLREDCPKQGRAMRRNS